MAKTRGKSAGKTMHDRTIYVKAENIDRAVHADSRKCMIANAVSEQVPGASFVSADIQTIRFSDLKTGKRCIYLTPHDAQQAILAFDQGKPIKPFKFVLWAEEGFEKPMRSREGDPAVYRERVRRNRKPSKPKRGPRGAQAMPTKTREFGLRAFTPDPPSKGAYGKRVGRIDA